MSNSTKQMLLTMYNMEVKVKKKLKPVVTQITDEQREEILKLIK